MKKVVFAIPGDLMLPTGGYAYDRALLAHLPAHGVAARHVALPAGFPHPSEADLAETGRLLLAAEASEPLLIDGLAYGAFPQGIAAGLAGRVVALVHHPLGLETGLAPAAAQALLARERAALGYAVHVIASSTTTRDTLVADFAVPEARITVAEPGVARAARATGSKPGEPLHLLAVGSLVPRKGYDMLIEALRPLAALPWRLTLAGAEDRSPLTAAALRAQIAASGLEGRITLAGAVDAAGLETLYASADIFLMPSHYEGYGMVVAEALAHGLPLVSTTGGALARTAPDAAALKTSPGDARAFGEALARLIESAPLRRALSDAAWALASALPTWDSTAAEVADVLRAIKP